MSDVTTCRTCGLPRFHGPAGYAGAQCLCQWKGATLPQMYDELMAHEREAFRGWQTKDGWKRPDDPGELEAFQAGAAWQRTQSAGVPEGWRLVPVEPTEQMANAYWDAYQKANDTHFMHCYRAMLAVAPAQPAARQDSNPEHTLFNEIRTSTPVSEDGEPLRYLISEQQLQRIRGLEAGNPAAQDQGEVQRLRSERDAFRDSRNYLIEEISNHLSEIAELREALRDTARWIRMLPVQVQGAIRQLERIDAALTSQEQKDDDHEL